MLRLRPSRRPSDDRARPVEAALTRELGDPQRSHRVRDDLGVRVVDEAGRLEHSRARGDAVLPYRASSSSRGGPSAGTPGADRTGASRPARRTGARASRPSAGRRGRTVRCSRTRQGLRARSLRLQPQEVVDRLAPADHSGLAVRRRARRRAAGRRCSSSSSRACTRRSRRRRGCRRAAARGERRARSSRRPTRSACRRRRTRRPRLLVRAVGEQRRVARAVELRARVVGHAAVDRDVRHVLARLLDEPTR